MSEKLTCRIEPADAPASASSGKVPTNGSSAADAAGAQTSAAQPSGDVAQPASGPEPTAQPASGTEPAAQPGVLARASRWLDETFPNSRNAVLGGVTGLVVALLLFSIGVLKTLVIAILVVVGIACGQYLDGEPKIVRFIQNLMKKR
ncbi:DUF2273 domain-containing protein [uncultured Parolsenella sp.]|uniref:DUF2273 domain-containing protein n=1 Tax=uncultured Parolsenella sp. TaxID=2083008 RepID=UPI0025FEACEA|nr:DUF2273 domain-containing protein [uncultured Parolsenella sp.]